MERDDPMQVKLKKDKRGVLNIRLTQKEHEEIRDKAQKYTAGNVSAWIRYAATELDPRAEDLEAIAAQATKAKGA